MKRVIQDLRRGATELQTCPAPIPGAGQVLVETRNTLISAGTERMLVEFGRSSLFGKARAQPDKVKQVLQKLQSDGVLPTIEAVTSRLDEPLPLGYCNAGVVVEVGRGVTHFRAGDRVASNGPHAELCAIPLNLCAKIPDAVSFEHAAFTPLAAIAIQAIRLARPELGERVVVYGLGLIGLVAVQLLRAAGCEVLGVDLSERRLELAEKFGADVVHPAADPVRAAATWTDGRGVDAVIIAASASTDEIVHTSAQICRKRGRIVLVGVVGLNLRRADFYDKELSFQVSCSYGPGRYDPVYEEAGVDYPIGFVRFTEQRNFETVLQLAASGKLQLGPLVTHRFALDDVPRAYELVRTSPDALGVVLDYPAPAERARGIEIQLAGSAPLAGPRLAVIGAGNFAKMTLIPALAKAGARVEVVCSRSGGGSAHLAKKFGIRRAVSDFAEVLADANVDAVLIATRHDSHARLACRALEAEKHVFVEKPLALDEEQISQLLRACAAHPSRQLMVGYNRRFSPHVVRMKELLCGKSEPISAVVTVNAGSIPAQHWVHDDQQGGGRIIGEACHFIDLLIHLTDSLVTSVSSVMMGPGPDVQDDKLCTVLEFEDGSIGTIAYLANGPKAYRKEFLEVFSDGRLLSLDNFRRLEVVGFPSRGKRTLGMAKGHPEEVRAFVDRLTTGGPPLIELSALVNGTLASFAAIRSAREKRQIRIADEFPNLWPIRVPSQSEPR